jgi:hypothetical protein
MNADGVLVVFGAPTSTRWIDGAWRNSCDPKYDAWMQSTFTDVVKTMQKFGPVWVTLEAYSRYGGMSLPQTDAETDCTNRAFHAAVTAGTSNARLIDLAHFVCPTELDCIDQIDGVRLRPDGLHFAGPGSDIAARWLFTQLGEDVDSTK